MITKDELAIKIIQSTNPEEYDENREKILNNYFKDKSSNEIAEYLANKNPEESGGLTAITGFYYQFLVTIEYIIQMLEDKWDYIIMEHHDDIVAVKENRIKYIQVKTSQEITPNTTETPARDLYYRSTKKINGNSYLRANSWVDKLISKATITPESQGFITEFELYSSYYFIQKKKHNFDFYTNKSSTLLDIPTEDDLLRIISKQVYNISGKLFDYEKECGEKVSELLKRFNIKTGPNLKQLEIMKNDLCMKLNKWIFKDIGDKFSINDSDLNTLIGLLFTQCTYKGHKNLLVIDRENIEKVLGDIRKKSINTASLDLKKHGSKAVLEKVFNDIQKEYEDYPTHTAILKEKLYDYKTYLEKWVSDEEGDIKELLERYIEGTTRTSVYSKLDETNRDVRLKEFLDNVLILNLSREANLKFNNNKKELLVKICEETDVNFSFLSPLKENNLQFAINFLESKFLSGEVENRLESIKGELYVVLGNYHDRNFKSIHKLEKYENTIEKIEELENGETLVDVPTKIFIVPSIELVDDYKDAIRKEGNIKNELEIVWAKYEKGETNGSF